MSLTRSDKPAHESECFKASTFASRKVQRGLRGELAPRPRRQVSLGVKEQFLEPFGSKGKARGQTVKIEYLVDRDHPTHYYTRAVPNGTLVRMDRGGTDDPPREDLGVITGRGISSGVFPDALPDSPATPIT